MYLLLLCCHEPFVCTAVTATGGLCHKTETLYPIDPRTKVNVLDSVGVFAAPETFGIGCVYVFASIFLYTMCWV